MGQSRSKFGPLVVRIISARQGMAFLPSKVEVVTTSLAFWGVEKEFSANVIYFLK
jgi:hypothetical protein